jgi:hypothetical protein
MDFGYLQSFFFSENGSDNNTATEMGAERNIAPTGDIENLVSMPLSGNDESTISSLDNPQVVTRAGKNALSPLKVSFARTLSNISGRIGSLVKTNNETADDLADGNKTVASSTESDTSQSSSEREKTTQTRGRSSSRRRSSSRGRSTSVSTSKKLVDEIEHIQCFAHGRVWTCLGIFFSWLGFFLAYLARASTDFASVDPPIYFDPNFETVSEVGMINLRLCFNESFMGQTGCALHELSTDDIDDMMFQLSRSVAFLAVLFGGIMSVFLTIAVFWHSINLRPVGLGFLIAYFLQSFCFLFFDASLCNKHKCEPGSGAKCAIVASLCWIGACVATSRMDAFKFRQRKLRLRRLRRQSQSRSRSPRKKTKKAILGREVSNVTAKTDSSYGSSNGFQESDLPVRAVAAAGGKKHTITIEGIDDIEAAQAWIALQARSNLERRALWSPVAPQFLVYDETASGTSHRARESKTSSSAENGSSTVPATPPVAKPVGRPQPPERAAVSDSNPELSSPRQQNDVCTPTGRLPGQASSPTHAFRDDAMQVRSPSYFEVEVKELPPPAGANKVYEIRGKSESSVASFDTSTRHYRRGERSMSNHQSRNKPPICDAPTVPVSPRGRSVDRRRSGTPRKHTSSAVSPNTGRSSDPRKEAVSHSRRDRSQSRKDRSVSLTRDSSHGRRGRSSSIRSRSSSIQSRSSSTQARTRSSSIQAKTRSSSRQGRTRATSQPRQDPARKTATSPSRNFATWHAQHSIRVEHVGHLSPSKRDNQLESRSRDVSKHSRRAESSPHSRHSSPVKNWQQQNPKSPPGEQSMLVSREEFLRSSSNRPAERAVSPRDPPAHSRRAASPARQPPLQQSPQKQSPENQQLIRSTEAAVRSRRAESRLSKLEASAHLRQVSPSRRQRQRSLSREPSMRENELTQSMQRSLQHQHQPSAEKKTIEPEGVAPQSPSKRNGSRQYQQQQHAPPEPKPSTEESFHSRLFAPFGL